MIIEQECGEFEIEMSAPNWSCGLINGEESRDVKLGVFVEFIDLHDVDPDISEKEKYHYVVEAHIVAHPDSLTEEGKDILETSDGEIRISDLHHSIGGVRVDLNWCRSVNEDWIGIKYKNVGSDIRFASWDDAQKFVDRILKSRLNGIMLMINFYLDQPLNKIGSTGWDMIEAMVYGKDFTENAFAKMLKKL